MYKPSKDGYLLVTSKNLKNSKLDLSESYFISKEDVSKNGKLNSLQLYKNSSYENCSGRTALTKCEA